MKCSFEEEINDPRHNPYLRLRTSKSPSVGIEKPMNDINSFPATILDPSLSALGNGQGQRSPPTLTDKEYPPTVDANLIGQIEALKSRYASICQCTALDTDLYSDTNHHQDFPIWRTGLLRLTMTVFVQRRLLNPR